MASPARDPVEKSETGGGGEVPLLLPIAITAFFATMIARVVISPVLPDIIESFGASRAALGLALTGMWAAYAVMQFFSGVLGAAYGERRVIIASMGLTGIASLGLSQAGTYPMFALMTLLVGASTGLYFSAGSTLLTRKFENIGQVLGFHSVGAPLAGLVGPVVAVAIAARWGWRSALLLGAVVAFPACLVVVWRVGSTPPTARDRSFRQQIEPRRLATILFRPSIAYTATIAVLVYFVWQTVYSFFPTFLVEHWNISQEFASVMFGGIFAGTIVTLPVVGRLSDEFGRDALLAGAFVSLAAGLVLLVVGDRFPVAVVGCSLVAVGMGFPGVLNSRFMDHLTTDERGQGFGLVRSVNLLVGSAGSTVTGVIADTLGWSAAFGLLPVLLLVPLSMIAGNCLLGADL